MAINLGDLGSFAMGAINEDKKNTAAKLEERKDELKANRAFILKMKENKYQSELHTFDEENKKAKAISSVNSKYKEMGGKINPIDKSSQVKGILIEGSKWFDVDHNYVNHFYDDVINNYDEWLKRAKNQGKLSRKEFSFNKMTEKIEEIFKLNLKELPKKMELKLPGIDKIKMPKKNKLKIVK